LFKFLRLLKNTVAPCAEKFLKGWLRPTVIGKSAITSYISFVSTEKIIS